MTSRRGVLPLNYTPVQWGAARFELALPLSIVTIYTPSSLQYTTLVKGQQSQSITVYLAAD